MKPNNTPSSSSEEHERDLVACVEQTPFQSEMATYRRLLITNESAMQSEFDKYILTLSTGALALSITFLKDVLNQHWIATQWLMLAWVSWAFSICGVVLSFFTSAKAMRTAVAQTDDMLLFKEANEGNLGGFWNRWTKRLNLVGGLLFIIGGFVHGLLHNGKP